MKKLMLGMLTATIVLSTGFNSAQASCNNAYEVKAERRATSNMNWTKVAVVSTGVTVLFGGPLLSGLAIAGASSGSAALGGAIVATVGTMGSLALGAQILGDYRDFDFKETKKNNYYKALFLLEAVDKEGKLPVDLVSFLDKEITLASYSDESIAKILKNVTEIVKKANEANIFCPVGTNKKIKVIKYGKIKRYIIDNLDLGAI